MAEPKDGALRVWWIPQVPMNAFYVPVASVEEGMLVLRTLARYDQFQLDNNIKPDYCNAGGLQQYLNGEKDWLDWETDDGETIDDVMGRQQEDE